MTSTTRLGNYSIAVSGVVMTGTRMTLQEARADARMAQLTNAFALQEDSKLILMRDVLVFSGSGRIEVEAVVIPNSDRVDAWLKGNQTVT